LIEGDITKENIKDRLLFSVKKHKIDIVVGGPPCQGFSYAGKRMIDDPRNFLYKEYVELVKKIKPRVVLIENVEGILTSNQGKTYSNIKEDFEKLGYNVIGKKMHAVQFGVPQKRKRVVIIGAKIENVESLFPKPIIQQEDRYMTVKDAIGDLPTIEVNSSIDPINKKIKATSRYQALMHGELKIENLLEIF